MELSFIIVTYKRDHILKLCLESIYAQEDLPANYEVIVIDNDGKAEVPLPPNDTILLQVIRSPENLGASRGRNLGMSLAQGKYWIFLDDDAVFRETSTAMQILDLFAEHPNCGAIAGCGYSPEGDLQIKNLPFADKKFAVALGNPTEAPYYYGFVHALRADVIAQVGNYPESFFIMMEEVDLSYRIIDAGYNILFDPGITVTHFHAEEGRATIGHNYWYRNTLNKMQLGWRLLPMPYPITIMFVWSIATLWYTKNLFVLWRIWRDFVRLFPELQNQRKPIQKKTISYLRRVGGRLLY